MIKLVFIPVLASLMIMNCLKVPLSMTDKYLQNRIIENSRKAKIDPFFTEAVIYAESGFKKRARSSSGAQGYMQVNVSAAVDGLRHSGYLTAASNVIKNPDLLYETDLNILSGTAYFRWILDKKRPTDWIEWLAYYNSGRPDYVVGEYIIKIKRRYEKNAGKSIEKMYRGIK